MVHFLGKAQSTEVPYGDFNLETLIFGQPSLNHNQPISIASVFILTEFDLKTLLFSSLYKDHKSQLS